jgi:branched-chain amino acid transport system permease protein
MVVYAPGGFAALIMTNLRVVKAGAFSRLYKAYAGLLVSGFVMFAGASSLIEMIYHLQLNSSMDTQLAFAGMLLDTGSKVTWGLVIAVTLASLFWFDKQRQFFIAQWEAVQTDIAQASQSGGAA